MVIFFKYGEKFIPGQVEETNSEEVEVRALPYVLILHAFCVVDPMLCAPASDPSQFVVTLQPYLKTQVISCKYHIQFKPVFLSRNVRGIYGDFIYHFCVGLVYR